MNLLNFKQNKNERTIKGYKDELNVPIAIQLKMCWNWRIITLSFVVSSQHTEMLCLK